MMQRRNTRTTTAYKPNADDSGAKMSAQRSFKAPAGTRRAHKAGVRLGAHSLLPDEGGALAHARKQHSLYRNAFIVAACVVAFITVWILMQPASALTLVCGQEEHTHTDACYSQVLVCGEEESSVHTHSDACYEKQLTCGLEEHTHTSACYAKVDGEDAADPAAQGATLTYKGEDYAVTVTYGEDAGLSGNVELRATEYEKDSDTYLDRYAEAAALYGWDEDEDYTGSIRLFNVGLYADGVEVEPEAPVQVNISYAADKDAEEVQITHFASVGTETVEDVTATYDDGVQTADFALDSFSDIMVYAGGPGGGNNQELNQSYWNKNAKLYWDTITATYTNGTVTAATANHSDCSKITSVYLNNIKVTNGDSGSKGWSGGTALSDYFPSASTTSEQTDVTLEITPTTGYYVSAVVVVCTGARGTDYPVSCNTFREGNAFTKSFGVSASGSTIVTVSSKDFSHMSKSSNYFILIELKPIPTPLYVAYEYGDAVSIIGDSYSSTTSAFSTHNGWVQLTSSGNEGSENKYMPNGDTTSGGGIESNYTLFKYTYAVGNASGVEDWRHYANYITEAAREEMARAGYYFAGWKAKFYTTTSALSGIASADVEFNENTGKYKFTNEKSYGESELEYNEGQQVNLITNVKLVAQWKPYTVTVKKVVAADDADTDLDTLLGSDGQTYRISLGDKTVNLTVKSSSENHAENTTIYPVKPGTYAVSETDPNTTITVDGVSYYCTTSYSTPSLEVTVDDIKGIVQKTVTVTNTYTKTLPTADIVVTKVDGSGKPLHGAEFVLYKTEGSKNLYYKYDDADGVNWVDVSANATTLNSANDGTFSIKSLNIGTYYLEETKAPDGYNKLSDKITIMVKSDAVTAVLGGSTGSSYNVTYDEGKKAYTFSVPNSNGYELPNTGGIGTHWYTLGGALLLALALVCGFVLRRKPEGGDGR